VPIQTAGAARPESSKATPAGFHAKPVNKVARSHSVTIQAAAKRRRKARPLLLPHRQARPAAAAG
jgi:hypothetical protein